jgi:hypothetical protein
MEHNQLHYNLQIIANQFFNLKKIGISMKLNYSFLLILAISTPAWASSLIEEREQVIHQYVTDLQQADYQNISNLFIDGGTVISTSKGPINAKDFFYGFLPEIESAQTELHQALISGTDYNRLAARFKFSFQLKNGETSTGEYVDEFLFANNSTKLVQVAMFENLKFKYS